jgi:lipoprotein-releasing system permease protein
MYKLFLTLRYLTRRPLSLVAVVALSLSVWVLVIAPSVMNGFQAEFHKRVRGTLSDVSLYSGRPYDFPHDPAALAALKKMPAVVAVAPYIETPALDRHLSRIDYCFMRGVDPAAEEGVSSFADYILSERDVYLAQNDYDRKSQTDKDALDKLADRHFPRELSVEEARAHRERIYDLLTKGDPDAPNMPTCLVGVYYLINWRLFIGDTIKVTTAREGGEVSQDVVFRIVGAFRTGFSDNDRRQIVTSIPTLQRFIGVPDRISGYSIRVQDYTTAKETRKAIERAVYEGALGPEYQDRSFFAQTWDERNRTLLQAVAMEKLLIRIITFLIVVAATASIFLVLFMAVHTKVRELGILRAVGGTRAGVLSLFVGQGFAIALTGMGVGLGLGVLSSIYINEVADWIYRMTGWHPFPPDVYYLDRIPTRIDFQENVVNLVIVLALGSVAALVPGVLAALRPPLKSIRYE